MKIKLQEMLKKDIKNSLFSGAGIGIFSKKNNLKIDIYQGTTNKFSGEPICENTFFDLASLTKAMVTALLTMTLVRDGLVLSTPLSEIYGEKIGIGGEVTIMDLLLHQSGFVDHRKFYERCSTGCKEFVISQIIAEKPIYKRGEKQVYSDLGYILLGDIIEKWSGENLASLWKKRIVNPLKLEDQFLFSSEWQLANKSCACTTNIVDNSVNYCGQVHDDNCRVMGGISGHAGLFGTIKGSLNLYISLLNCFLGKGDLSFIKEDILKQFWKRPEKSRWALGFDTPAALFSTSGKYFSQESVGHLGFTGTSFWIDPVKEIVVVVFTNRAIYNNNLSDMKKFRPRIHNAIMEELKTL